MLLGSSLPRALLSTRPGEPVRSPFTDAALWLSCGEPVFFTLKCLHEILVPNCRCGAL